MEMLISRDWLRRKIEADPDFENDASVPAALFESLGMFLPAELHSAGDEEASKLKEAFGILIRQLRRRDGLSIEDLAKKARVSEDELHEIESNPDHKPRPRTVHQLSSIFHLPERAVMKLSGATVTQDHVLAEEAMRFAAKSRDLAALTAEEVKTLKAFVRYLAKVGSD